jgi:peptide/nickel transport system permease protein
MIPTLFGVTIVSFVIMQLAPGDPLLNQLGASGTAGQSSQTREAYLIQKRDLRLDKPLILNTRYFTDFRQPIRIAAEYRAMTSDEVASRLGELSGDHLTPAQEAELRFLHGLGIPKFEERLHPPDLTPAQLEASHLTSAEWEKQRTDIQRGLAKSVEGYLQVWVENVGPQAVEAAVYILREEPKSRLAAGAVNCLAAMVVNPFAYTFSREPTEEEARKVEATWRLLWSKQSTKFEPVDADRDRALQQLLQELVSSSRADMFKALQSGKVSREDAPFFFEVLVSDSASLHEKVIAAEFLRLFVPDRLQLEVARDAVPEKIAEVATTWITHYESMINAYRPSLGARVYYLFTDTQYAHMVWRLLTFQFGRSALKTREPVSKLIWDALLVSAPLMLLSQLLIYALAVPAGTIAAVNRNNWIDRGTTLILFLLYSVPPFVAGMLFLLYFAYGSYLKIVPMERLHSAGSEHYSTIGYVVDYLWHAIGPVLCLSVFSIAGLAMYGRSALLDVLGQDYIRTARAKGLSGTAIVLRHALRNGMIPMVTLFASFIPGLLGGSVLIEYLFNINGMGQLSYVSIQQKDIPTVMAIVYVDAIVVMLSILLSDLLYVLIDPRISFEGKSG